MGDIVSSLRDQLTKATGKTFSLEQIAGNLKELQDEQAARDSIDPEEIEKWRDRKRQSYGISFSTFPFNIVLPFTVG